MPIGATGAATITAEVVTGVPVSLLSLTVNVTVKVPDAAYVWLGETPLPVLPSPKFQRYVSASELPSVEPAPLNVTAVPATPL